MSGGLWKRYHCDDTQLVEDRQSFPWTVQVNLITLTFLPQKWGFFCILTFLSCSHIHRTELTEFGTGCKCRRVLMHQVLSQTEWIRKREEHLVLINYKAGQSVWQIKLSLQRKDALPHPVCFWLLSVFSPPSNLKHSRSASVVNMNVLTLQLPSSQRHFQLPLSNSTLSSIEGKIKKSLVVL